MEIYAEPGIKDVLAKMFAEISGQDVKIVQLEQAGDLINRQDVAGLNITLNVAKEGAPVVMLGWMPIRMYIDRKPREWFAVMGYPNVMFRRLPVSKDDVLSAIEEAKVGPRRQPDPLAIALLDIQQFNTTVGVLRHDLSSAERNAERMTSWTERARSVFGDRSQSELVSLAKDCATTGREGVLAGQTFPDVCVDIEGTILGPDGKVRPEVLALAEEKANGGPIAIWTGGDVDALTQQLRDAGVRYKILSKDTMKGATVRVVIDDQSEEIFKNDYGVGYQEYVRV